MRALVVSNMLPDQTHPERGRFVRDQVSALQALGEASVELYELAPGARALARAAIDLRRRYRGQRFDVVHAHFGLTAWPALAVDARVRALTLHGTDVSHPRTRIATRLVLPRIDLVATASRQLIEQIPGASARARARVLPCGVDTSRFTAIERKHAREQIGLDPAGPYLLFAADPARAEKRFDRAHALASAVGAELLTLGGVEPERVPLFVNAANAVIVTSEREGFGLAALESLACDVPVLATPVGAHSEALEGIEGCLCAPFELDRWAALAAAHTGVPDPRVAGRARAQAFSTAEMARRVLAAWRSLADTDS